MRADYVRAKLDGAGHVPRIPPFSYGGDIFFQTNRFGLNILAMHSSVQNKAPAAETPAGGFTMIEVAANYQIYQYPGLCLGESKSSD